MAHTHPNSSPAAGRDSEYDVVIASRYIDGGVTENDKSLIWMSRLLNVSYAIILGLKCKDVSTASSVPRGSDKAHRPHV